MGSCSSGDHIAGDHIHTDITRCNIKEPQQKDHLGTVSSILFGCLKYVLLDANPRFFFPFNREKQKQ